MPDHFERDRVDGEPGARWSANSCIASCCRSSRARRLPRSIELLGRACALIVLNLSVRQAHVAASDHEAAAPGGMVARAGLSCRASSRRRSADLCRCRGRRALPARRIPHGCAGAMSRATGRRTITPGHDARSRGDDADTRHHAAMMHDHGAASITVPSTDRDQKQTDSHGKSPPANCCGMFCVTASTVALDIPARPVAPHARASCRCWKPRSAGLAPTASTAPPSSSRRCELARGERRGLTSSTTRYFHVRPSTGGIRCHWAAPIPHPAALAGARGARARAVGGGLCASAGGAVRGPRSERSPGARQAGRLSLDDRTLRLAAAGRARAVAAPANRRRSHEADDAARRAACSGAGAAAAGLPDVFAGRRHGCRRGHRRPRARPGRSRAAHAARGRTPRARAIEQLLRRRLTADAAVQIALLNNRGLQAAYNELGLAEAAMVEASLPPSPTVSVQRLAGSAEVEIERRIVGDILALATLPARAEIAADRFRQAQLRAADDTLRRRGRDPARLFPRGRGARACRLPHAGQIRGGSRRANWPSASARPAP